MTLAFKNENRKLLLAQTNTLLFKVLIVFILYSSVLSVISFYIGALGEFIIVEILFNVVRVVALISIQKIVKNENIKYSLFVCFGMIGFIFSFFTLRDYVGIFYGALVYCYITIIIISLKRIVASVFAGVGVLAYLILFYIYPYKNIDIEVSYYLSQIGFILIYNFIVLKVMDYFKIYESKIYDQIDLIEHQKDSLEEQKRELLKSEERYRLVFDASRDGLWDYDMINRNIYYSEQALELLKVNDFENQEFISLHCEAIPPEDYKTVKTYRKEILNGKRDKYTIEFKYKASEHFLWLEEQVMVLRDQDGNIKRIGGSISDITEKKLKDVKIHTLAYYDTLTLLPNRSFFYEEINRIIETQYTTMDSLAIIILDIDDFKLVNDIFGHEIGDEVLLTIANRFKAMDWDNITIARLGGDEFGLLVVEKLDEEEITEQLSLITQLVDQPIKIMNHDVKLTSSMGISFFPKDGTDKEILLKNAELALYKAKSLGKSCYNFFDIKMAEELLKKVDMGLELKEAINKNELLLYYQPLINCDTKKLTGFEALIRWDSPKYGRVSPNDFIPLAEEIGAINEIGKWVFKEAGIFSKKINKLFPKEINKLHLEEINLPEEINQLLPDVIDTNNKKITVSINVSPVQVIDHFFIEDMMGITEEYGIDPNIICIEITENALISSFDHAIANIKKLSELGFIISIDDFGTGYSSLSYLKNLPASIIKIDKSFVDHIENNSKDLDLIKTIISLGKVLNMEVVAEGVENLGQYDLLKEHKCDIIQGFLFSKPLTEEDANTYLLKNLE
ncbi:MAG: hypothetical protein CVU84_04840 [Firmicutes bacterium HGW-Firmicutes-1]|jgi:diguanylate cyclase (GGDEF)-like protein/PAS domain S-box-containing protein|nr:MAG: hypothetical protein CVU84_04840 [Firmicutes bacterium HGW-Firmicutes-1]